jgi:hypothetical protein
MRYQVAYYNTFGDMRWEPTGSELDDLNEAIAERDKLNATLDKGTFECCDHYGIIDLNTGVEIECPLNDSRKKYGVI